MCLFSIFVAMFSVSPITKNNYFNALTGVRAIAAIMVFIYHNRKYWKTDLPTPILRLISEFHVGVTVFFVLSGFLLAYRYQEKPLQNGRSYLKYFLSRAARIFPLYWLLITCFFLDNTYSANVKTYFLHYSLLYPLFDKYVLDGIAQAWSLCVELGFYLFSPLIFLLLKKKWIYALLFLFLLFLLAYGTGISLHKFNGNPKGFLYPISFVMENTFFGRSLEFFAGVALAYIMNFKPEIFLKFKKYKTSTGFLIFFFSLTGIALFAKDSFTHGVTRWEGRLIHETLLPIGIAIFFWGLLTEKTWLRKILSSQVFVLLGNASFIFYLIHISYFNLKLKSYLFLPDRNFVLLWICSILIYLVLEKPLYKQLRKLIAKI